MAEPSKPEDVDYSGKDCTECKEGTYGETSVYDDWHGKLHCRNCGHEVNRWNEA